MQTCACPRRLSHPWKCPLPAWGARSLLGVGFPGGSVTSIAARGCWGCAGTGHRPVGCFVVWALPAPCLLGMHTPPPPPRAHWHLNRMELEGEDVAGEQ